jgi:hypothetical protein
MGQGAFVGLEVTQQTKAGLSTSFAALRSLRMTTIFESGWRLAGKCSSLIE